MAKPNDTNTVGILPPVFYQLYFTVFYQLYVATGILQTVL